jgi:hypothetical protein
MIVTCRTNNLSDIPQQYLMFGPDTLNADDGKIATTVGKSYAVYAIRQSPENNAKWYFVHTDSNYLWWMPAIAFEMTESSEPEKWVAHIERSGDILSSYPSLQEWSVEEGIIDGDEHFTELYMNEVDGDDTFPAIASIVAMNEKLDQRLKDEEYERKLKEAKERGWELPRR